MDDPRGPGDKVGNVTIDDTEPLLTPQQVAAMFRVDSQNGDPVGGQRADRVHPHPRRAPQIPGIGDPGAARRADHARRAHDSLTTHPGADRVPGPRAGPAPSPPLNAREPVSSDDEPVG